MLCCLALALGDFSISRTKFLRMDVNQVIDKTNELIIINPDNNTLLMSQAIIVDQKKRSRTVRFDC